MIFDTEWSLSTICSPYVCTQQNFNEAYLFSLEKIRDEECWKAICNKFLKEHFTKSIFQKTWIDHINQILKNKEKIK